MSMVAHQRQQNNERMSITLFFFKAVIKQRKELKTGRKTVATKKGGEESNLAKNWHRANDALNEK